MIISEVVEHCRHTQAFRSPRGNNNTTQQAGDSRIVTWHVDSRSRSSETRHRHRHGSLRLGVVEQEHLGGGNSHGSRRRCMFFIVINRTRPSAAGGRAMSRRSAAIDVVYSLPAVPLPSIGEPNLACDRAAEHAATHGRGQVSLGPP